MHIVADQPRVILEALQVVRTPEVTTVSWTHPGGTVDSFLVQYVERPFYFTSPSADLQSLTVSGADTSVQISNLPEGARYRVRVATRNQNGLSAFSPDASIDVLHPPTTPPPTTPPPTTPPPFTGPSKHHEALLYYYCHTNAIWSTGCDHCTCTLYCAWSRGKYGEEGKKGGEKGWRG